MLNRMIVILSVALAMGGISSAAEEKPYKMPSEVKTIARRFLAAKDSHAAVAVLKDLKAADVPNDVLAKLGKMRYLKKIVPFRRALATMERPFKNFSNERRVTALIKKADEWKALGDDALAYIFDDSKYAVPAKALTGWYSGKDIQPNQGIVEGKVERAVETWNQVAADFASLAGGAVKKERKPGGGGFAAKLKRGELNEPSKIMIPILKYTFTDPTGVTTMAKKYGRSYADFRKEWKRFEPEVVIAQATGYRPEKIIIRPLPLAVSALFAGEIADADSFAPQAGTTNGKLFAIFVMHSLYAKSLEPPEGWSKDEHEALKANNLYRMSLGLHPMLADAKLHACAKNHSLYQKKHGLGHFQKSDDMRTTRDRARKVGYTAGVTENCSSGTLETAIHSWRCDAGHHRNLIRRSSQVVGISTAGFPTHNTGYKCRDAVVARLFKHSY